MRRVLLLLGAGGCVLAAIDSAAQVPEAELKAAFLFNFAVFTEWPPRSLAGDGLLTFCVAQSSPLRDAVLQLVDRPVNGRKVRVLTMPADLGRQSSCRVWLVDGADAAPGPPPTYGLLTVSDGADLDSSRAVIALDVEGDHVRFDIDTAAAAAAGLRLSSKLLRLARSTR